MIVIASDIQHLSGAAFPVRGFDFAFSGQINDLFAFELVGSLLSWRRFSRTLCRPRRARSVVVIVLRPAVEGMIVALGALQTRAETWAVASARATGRGSRGSNWRWGLRRCCAAAKLADKLVHRLAFGDALANQW